MKTREDSARLCQGRQGSQEALRERWVNLGGRGWKHRNPETEMRGKPRICREMLHAVNRASPREAMQVTNHRAKTTRTLLTRFWTSVLRFRPCFSPIVTPFYDVIVILGHSTRKLSIFLFYRCLQLFHFSLNFKKVFYVSFEPMSHCMSLLALNLRFSCLQPPRDGIRGSRYIVSFECRQCWSYEETLRHELWGFWLQRLLGTN